MSGGEYVVMLELPEAAAKAPAGPVSRAARMAVAEATQKQVDTWQSKGVEVKQQFKAIGGFTADPSPAQVKTLNADPGVAGTAALYLEQHPNAGVAEVERALKSSATPGTIDYVRGSANLMLNTSLLTGAR